MRFRQTNLHELRTTDSARRQPWLRTACSRLRILPEHASSRLLVAEEDGRVRAVLGLRLFWGANGRLAKAVICVLEVDPDHDRRGIGARLVRFAEGIARVHGCARVDVVPDLESWGGGECWIGLGYDDPGAGLHKVLRPSGQWKYA
jgi:ribosomal protein S18 acetylase RimI-like enzyme